MYCKCIIQREVVMFLSFRKNKETKCIPVQISKKFKRVTVSFSKMCRSKMFVMKQKLLRTLEIHYKIFDNSHLKLEKRKRQKLKNSIFDGLLIVNQTLANRILHILCIFIKPNVLYLRSLKILAIKRQLSFNFAKILQSRHFVVGGPKNIKLLADISFESSLQNTVLSNILLFLCGC